MKLITIAVATYNRQNILERMARSLYSSILSYPYEIRVYDDASTDYGKDELRRLFPNAASIIIHERNIGPDRNVKYIYHDFLDNGGDYLIHADSDLIFAQDWMEAAIRIEDTDGVLSLFNAKQHSGEKIGNGLVEKKSIGCAGTVFKRNIIEQICNSRDVYAEKGIDWQWSRFLRSEGIRLITTEKSYVQHIGFVGDHSANGVFDYGEGFEVDSVQNGQMLNDTLEELSVEKYNESLTYLHNLFIFPYEKIQKDSRVVLYGAGKVGQSFVLQLQNSKYCTLSGVVDKRYAELHNVLPPDALKVLDYDYIVIALSDRKNVKDVLCEIRQIVQIDDDRLVTVEGIESVSLRIKDVTFGSV